MGFWCVAITYMLRVCLNIAITQMVIESSKNNTHIDPNSCPDPQNQILVQTFEVFNVHNRYDWDEELQGIILGAFYYGYVLTHVPGGLIAEKYGAKYTAGIGVLITALLTIATPFFIDFGGSTALIVVRAVEGIGEGPMFPAMSTLMSCWVPKQERGIMGSLIFGGAQIGNILGMVISGFLMDAEGNWPSVFYTFGSLGVVWFILWTILVYSEPKLHPFISDDEKAFLEKHIEEKTKKRVPWKPFLLSIPLWSIVIAAIGHDWGYFTIVTDLPKYMTEVLKFNISSTGLLAALPYAVMWITSMIFGSICDLLIKKGYISIKNSRKLYTTIGAIGPGVFIVGASYVGCDATLSVAMFTIGMGFMGAYYCGMKVNVLDITPNYAGTATAFINGIAAISGIITPYIVGVIAPNHTSREWQTVFWIVLAVLFVTNVIYIAFAEGEELWWNDIEKNGYPSNWKSSENDEENETTK
ncbi:sialin-like [Arctopsyche grandis]|uniref:sialin-like n=1 Tax=Arctopsyche grandis TaxID=121162 RepID=UPI00406D8425